MRPLETISLQGIALALLPFVLLACGSASSAPATSPIAAVDGGPVTVVVQATPGQPVASFDPATALGAGIDGQNRGQIDRMLSAPNIAEMVSSGLRPISYRLRTELGGETWHWNSAGTWSDAAHKQGYWVSDSSAAIAPIQLSWGYHLPRRGNTRDQANDDEVGYSRLDDGDLSTFWKSNPYLDQHFTSEPNSSHPQWLVADLGSVQDVDAMRIVWGDPFATDYVVQYADDRYDNLSFSDDAHVAMWTTFSAGIKHGATGGDVTLVLSPTPVQARYVRVLMTASATTIANPQDLRDSLGYSAREVYVGIVDSNGTLKDALSHGSGKSVQSEMYVSSTDPWHRDVDQDVDVEQPGLDRIFTNGLARGPTLVPVGVLYDTPENAVAEVRYLRARGYDFNEVEIGEESEEQYGFPADYANLYLQWVDALRAVDSSVRFGGPSLVADIAGGWPDHFIQGFWSYLAAHPKTDAYQFFSFEWYPFDNVCGDPASQLAELPGDLDKVLTGFHADGLPSGIPVYITEYGYSPYSDETEVDVQGAVLNVLSVAQSLQRGVARAYLYGYEPNEIIHEYSCTWGNNELFGIDADGTIAFRTATYWGSTLMTQRWASPGGGAHDMFPVAVTAADGTADVTAFAVHRPDSSWGLLALNRSATSAHDATFAVRDQASSVTYGFEGAVDVYQFSPEQYSWVSAEDLGHPLRSDPPSHSSVSGRSPVRLPPYSITVVVGSDGTLSSP